MKQNSRFCILSRRDDNRAKPKRKVKCIGSIANWEKVERAKLLLLIILKKFNIKFKNNKKKNKKKKKMKNLLEPFFVLFMRFVVL